MDINNVYFLLHAILYDQLVYIVGHFLKTPAHCLNIICLSMRISLIWATRFLIGYNARRVCNDDILLSDNALYHIENKWFQVVDTCFFVVGPIRVQRYFFSSLLNIVSFCTPLQRLYWANALHWDWTKWLFEIRLFLISFSVWFYIVIWK